MTLPDPLPTEGEKGGGKREEKEKGEEEEEQEERGVEEGDGGLERGEEGREKEIEVEEGGDGGVVKEKEIGGGEQRTIGQTEELRSVEGREGGDEGRGTEEGEREECDYRTIDEYLGTWGRESTVSKGK